MKRFVIVFLIFFAILALFYGGLKTKELWQNPSISRGLKPGSLSVVVTLKPIHSLVCAVTEGLLTPNLLLTNEVSPHTHSLTPKEIAILLKADLVIWVGEPYEANMQQTLRKLIPKSKLLTLSEIKSLTLYSYRQEGLWRKEQQDIHAHNSHPAHSIDGHIWLSPNNAVCIVKEIANLLERLDPENSFRYQENAKKTIQEITYLDQTLQTDLKNIQKKPYIIYHDAMQYFDRHFGTQAIAAITTEPTLPPNAKHLMRLEALLADKSSPFHPFCIFSEPTFASGLSKKLSEKFSVNHHMLDYLGQSIPSGPRAYFIIMNQLAKDLKKGLS